MSVMRIPTGSTDVCYESIPVDKGNDNFLIFILFLIVWWFVLNN